MSTVTYSATVIYLVNQIVLGNLTYLEVIAKKPTLQPQIDSYIDEKGLTINKTV